jgi:hypothetical protein
MTDFLAKGNREPQTMYLVPQDLLILAKYRVA